MKVGLEAGEKSPSLLPGAGPEDQGDDADSDIHLETVVTRGLQRVGIRVLLGKESAEPGVLHAGQSFPSDLRRGTWELHKSCLIYTLELYFLRCFLYMMQNFTPGYIHKGMENIYPQKNMCTSVHNIIGERQKTNSSKVQQMNRQTKMFTHSMEYHSAIKRNRELTKAATWTTFENSVPSVRSQVQKAACYRIPFK